MEQQILEAHSHLVEDAVRVALAFAARALRADVIYPNEAARAMKPVADASMDQQVVEALRSNGHTVQSVVETCPGSTDDDVLAQSSDVC